MYQVRLMSGQAEVRIEQIVEINSDISKLLPIFRNLSRRDRRYTIVTILNELFESLSTHVELLLLSEKIT